MLMDQAQALRELVATTAGPEPAQLQPTVARAVAIGSGKGGVGKTSLAVNLAARLAEMGRRVVLVDADLGTANADLLCGITPARTLAHVIARRCPIQQALVSGPGGLRLLPGASGLAQVAALGERDRRWLMQQIEILAREADLLLIDVGAGISPNVLGFAMMADQLVVVATSEPTAIADAYALIKTSVRHRDELGVSLVVNRVRDLDEARGVHARMDLVSRRFLGRHLRFEGHLIEDSRVGAAVRRRRPFVLASPRCEASQCIDRMAHRLDRHAVAPGRRGLVGRLTAWLGA